MPESHFLQLQPSHFRSLLLFVITLGNYGFMYTANIMLARSLTVSEFDDYSVAVSVATMLSTLATLGLEKYALRGIALFRDRQDWCKFRGFWQFATKTITVFSLLLFLALTVSLETILAWQQADYHIAIVLFAGFLPVMAMTLFLVEFTAAQGAHFIGIAVYRLLLPLGYVLILSAVKYQNWPLSAASAVICFGCAWFLSLLVLSWANQQLMPTHLKQVTPFILPVKWLKRSLPLVMNSLMLTVMTSSGVVILELLYPSGWDVGIYAVAAQTGGFISLIGTSTNRYYLPMMVVLVEHQDNVGIKRLIQQRALVVGNLIILLLAVLAFYGQHILSLFGQAFLDSHLTMVIIATGGAFSALFADMPYYLQFMGFNQRVLTATFLATASMITLAFILGKQFGTVGVSIAYMLPVAMLFTSFRLMVGQHFKNAGR